MFEIRCTAISTSLRCTAISTSQGKRAMNKITPSFISLVLLALPATGVSSYLARGITRPDGGSEAALVKLIDQEVKYQSRTDPSLPAARSVHIVSTLIQRTGAAIIVTYALKHPAPGCLGIGWMFAVRTDNRWVAATPLQFHESCLSAKVLIDLRWAKIRSIRYSGDVVYGRTAPSIHTLRVVKHASMLIAPIRHNSFLISASCASVQRVQGLDAHNHVLYATKLPGCI